MRVASVAAGLFGTALIGSYWVLSNERAAPPKIPTSESAPAMSADELPAAASTRLQDFEADWRARGRKMSDVHSWLRARTIWVLAEAEVPPDVVEKTRSSLEVGLAEIGVRGYQINLDPGPFPPELSACVEGAILDYRCYVEAVPRLRNDVRYSGSILVIVTNAAIQEFLRTDRKPFTITTSGGTSPQFKSVPPGGMASKEHGFAVVSEYWAVTKKVKPLPGRPDYPPELRHQWRMEQSRHSSTPRHELFHVFGLPHHGEIKNPGLPEPPLCTEHKSRPPHTDSPHPECVMVCGGGYDQKPHFEKHGKHYGLCPTCLAAVRAIVAGIEGR